MVDEIRSSDEKRRFKRIKFEEAVRYQIKGSNHFGGCLARDVSPTGMQINFNDFIPLDTEMTLEFDTLDKKKQVNCEAHVVWAQRVPFLDRYRLGLKFTQAIALE